MTMTDELYALASGYNVPLGSLVKITSIIPGGDEAFAGPAGIAHYDPGLVKINGDGTIRLIGFAKVIWLEGFLTYAQLPYLSTTYCSGGLTGPVTIYTTLGTPTFVRMNALMTLPKPTDLQSRMSWYTKAGIAFTRLKPAS